MKQKCILVITDGIGYSKSKKYNAFFKAKKRAYNYLFKNSHQTLIRTSGNAVGLPKGQMGNSEVGHMILGSGRVIKQDLVKIDDSIKDGQINTILKEAADKRSAKRYHIIGLYSDGGVHSSFAHFHAVCLALKNLGKEVVAHLISDGRDVLKDSFYPFVEKNLSFFNGNQIKIASLSGRFWAMDRDKNYDRVEKYINAFKSSLGSSYDNNDEILSYIKSNYDKGVFDEMLEPKGFGKAKDSLDDDVFLVINFRNDRVRQLCEELNKINSSKNIITMTNYDDKFDYEILFKKDEIKNTLAEVLSKNGLTQYHTAETEKYAHVSFFFNSREEPYKGEERKLIPSPKISYDKIPQMSAYEVCQSAIHGIQNYDFTVVNFANGDMVGHTGDFKASIKAVEVVDECLDKIIKECKKQNCALVLCSDHGNCELMQKNGKVIKNHTTFDVFCFVACDEFGGFTRGKLQPNQSLANIAPTILKIMGLDIPKQMTSPLF